MIKPLGNRVLIEKVAERKQGFVLLPDSISEKVECYVRALGPDVKTISVGDKVIYNKFGSAEVVDDDMPEAKFVLVAENEIFAKKE